jgi:N-acyl-D-amino-acid deacylase
MCATLGRRRKLAYDAASARSPNVATYADPNQFSVGMEYVLVNGVPVISQGKMTGALPGKVLYGPGYHAKP